MIKIFYDDFWDINITKYIKIPYNRKIRNLSSGMNRKLGLLQAFIGKPMVLIMDEPTTNLDPIVRADFLNLVKELHENYKIDFLISSHILSDLQQVANNFIVLNEGYLRFNGSYSELLHQFYSKTFEIHVENVDSWMKNLMGLEIVLSLKNHYKIIYIETKEEISSIEFLNQIFPQKFGSEYEFSTFKRVLNVEKLFITPNFSDSGYKE
jgi:ABC-type multidrug transport system ATPase subunit